MPANFRPWIPIPRDQETPRTTKGKSPFGILLNCWWLFPGRPDGNHAGTTITAHLLTNLRNYVSGVQSPRTVPPFTLLSGFIPKFSIVPGMRQPGGMVIARHPMPPITLWHPPGYRLPVTARNGILTGPECRKWRPRFSRLVNPCVLTVPRFTLYGGRDYEIPTRKPARFNSKASNSRALQPESVFRNRNLLCMEFRYRHAGTIGLFSRNGRKILRDT